LELTGEQHNMKTLLKTSILLNMIFLGGILILWRHPRTVTVPAPPPPMAVKVEPQTPPIPVIPTFVAPFRWSQLMSTNGYRTFVANLRAAGCPKSTVEDIVRGDTERAFSWERRRLGIDGNQPGYWSSQVQTQMVAYFLGQAPLPITDAAGDIQPAGAATPLVLQNVDLSTFKLNDAETQAIANIREDFLNNIGGANQDASDPAYLARWQKAQFQADTTLHSILGENAFDQYELQAYQIALQNEEASAGK
jgi:hypothetical protein